MASTDAAKVISLQDIKDFCKISGTAEDTYLAAWREQAVAEIELFMRMQIAANPHVAILSVDGVQMLDIRAFPVMSVQAIKDVYGSDLGLVKGEDFLIVDETVIAGVQPWSGCLERIAGKWWGMYRVEFTSGFNEVNGMYDIPEVLRGAVLRYVSFLRNDWQVKKVKVGDISYDYITSGGIAIPAEVGNTLLSLMPVQVF